MESFKYERGTSKKGKFSRIINYANNAHSRKKVVNARDQLWDVFSMQIMQFVSCQEMEEHKLSGRIRCMICKDGRCERSMLLFLFDTRLRLLTSSNRVRS